MFVHLIKIDFWRRSKFNRLKKWSIFGGGHIKVPASINIFSEAGSL
jgi:hypothetical protein